MKKVFSLLSAIVLVVTLSTASALAVVPEEKTIDLGGGFYVVETVIHYSPRSSDDMVYGSKTSRVYQGSSLIGTATLAAAFDISGSTAKATEAAITGSGSNGGTYTRGTTSCSGNTATGNAYFKYSGVERILRISISCSSSGVLS